MDPRIARHILDMEGSRENQAIKTFRETTDRHQAMLDKQKEFEEYRAEYDRQIQQLGRSGTSIDSEVLTNYHQFKGALDTAIDQQDGLISESENRVEDTLSAWSASHRRRQALEQLIDNQNRERRLSQDKYEQKLMDEQGMNSRALS